MAVITVSREYGTGGMKIAREVADRLGYRFIFREELTQKIREKGLDVDLDRFEGRAPTFFERLFKIDREKLMEKIRETMREEADAGDVVFGGWGGQTLHKDRKDTFHVRIIGTTNSRVRYLMDSSGMSRSGAEESVHQADRDQSLFSQYFFSANFADPMHYHLVINLDQLSHEAAVALLIDAFQKAMGLPEQRPA
ncbi:MAG: cytidylate kinase-like family protein [bacterium]|nr:cytidylate kinase-like family protein [bacterium]